MTIAQDLEFLNIVSDAVTAKCGRDARFYCIKRLPDEMLPPGAATSPVIVVYGNDEWPGIEQYDYIEFLRISTWVFEGPQLTLTHSKNDAYGFYVGERLRPRKCTCGSHAVNPGLETSRHPNHCDLRK